jgi:L-lactate dehydrogenase complex protein LldF
VTRNFDGSPPFPEGARAALDDPQLRANLAGATRTIRAKRDRVVGELDTWEDLRLAGEAIRSGALGRLDELLVKLEARVERAGGRVHWARDAAEASRLVVELVRATGESSVVKVKSMTTSEIGLNQALEAAGVTAYETDLAELIVQLGDDLPSHIVVPAIHRNREEIRATFAEEMGRWGRPAPDGLTSDPAALAGAARLHLRDQFLRARVGVSGANFLVAETGSVAVVESEGNGRMCVTLPDTLITVAGIDKVVPRFEDLDALLQLLPRSATGERMNPYTSVWTGVHPGDGPQAFHLVLVDGGRSRALADQVGRQALRCIRCAACLNVCPVYERVGGHAYGSVYPGPIGAVLTPQLDHVAGDEVAASLPYASTLCGACFDACPVRIDIPRLLVHLRAEVVDAHRGPVPTTQEQAVMAGASWLFARPGRLRRLVRLGAAAGRRLGSRRLPLPGWLGGWSRGRATPLPTEPSFADWWHRTRAPGPPAPDPPAGPRRRPPRPDRPVPAGLEPHRAVSGSSAREDILGRVRRATAGATPAPPPRAYRRPPAGRAALPPVELFAERVADYDAVVTRTGPGDLAAAVARLAGDGPVGVPADLPPAWVATVGDLRPDDPPLATPDLDGLAAVVTACAVGVAETGTVVLDGGPGQGRRALTLVPDHHIVVVFESQVLADVPAAVAGVRATGPQTWISGPSATSDIELSRVGGVHGPRRLDVVLCTGAPTGVVARG